MRNNLVGAGFNIGANALMITFVGITAAAGVRVATYGLMLFLNHRSCVRRGLAPSLSEVFTGRIPRVVTRPRTGVAAVRDVPEDYYRRLHEVDTRHWWHLGMRSVAEALLAGRLHGALLDAGCGTGGFLAWAASTGAFTRLCGIDLERRGRPARARDGAGRRAARSAARPHPVRRRGVRPRRLARRPPARARSRARREPRGSFAGCCARVGRCSCARTATAVPVACATTGAPTTPQALAADLRRAGFAVRRVTYANARAVARRPRRGAEDPRRRRTRPAGSRPSRDGAKAAVGRALLELEARLVAQGGRAAVRAHPVRARRAGGPALIAAAPAPWDALAERYDSAYDDPRRRGRLVRARLDAGPVAAPGRRRAGRSTPAWAAAASWRRSTATAGR